MFSQPERFVAEVALECGHQPHPAPPIAEPLQPPETPTAVDLGSLPSGTELVVETRNSRYRIVMLDRWEALVQGGRYFPQETTARIEGCTPDGCLLKLNWIAQGHCLELSICGKRIVTSRVRSISVTVDPAAA